MSESELIAVTCPECGASGAHPKCSNIRADSDEESRRALMDGSLLNFECPSCKVKTPIAYSLMYFDGARKYVVWLRPGVPAPSELLSMRPLDESMRCRVVTTANALREKIRIFDADLDDRCVELVKIMVMNDLNVGEPLPELRVSMVGEHEGTRMIVIALIDGNEYMELSVPLDEKYAAAMECLSDVPPTDEWQIIDADFATQHVKCTGTD